MGLLTAPAFNFQVVKSAHNSSRSLQWMWNFQKQLKPLGNFVSVLQSPRIWNSWLWYESFVTFELISLLHRQTVFLQNIDIWVNFKATVKIFVWFWAQKFWTLESPGVCFCRAALENVLRVHHALERATTTASGSCQRGASTKPGWGGLKPLLRRESKREWGRGEGFIWTR